jgi:hypothetical protein
MATLYELYEKIEEDLYNSVEMENAKIADDKFKAANPLFLALPNDEYMSEYLKADIKLMIFGMETNGWGGIYGQYEDRLDTIIDDYTEYFCGLVTDPKRPIFRGSKCVIDRLHTKIGGNKSIEYIWNNIVKMGYAGKNLGNYHFPAIFYNRYDVIKKYLNPLIPKEIEILKPDYIVFFTGPKYDFIIDDVFQKPKRILIDGFDQNDLCEIVIPNAKKAFRTHHPHNTKKPMQQYYEKIADEIYQSL